MMIEFDGKFGQVVIVQPDDPRFGQVIGGLPYGQSTRPITVRNTGSEPLRLLAPPNPNHTNPTCTNTAIRASGFAVGDIIEPGQERSGVITFAPRYRGLHIGTLRFLTEPPGDYYIKNVGGQGIVNASAEVPVAVSCEPAGALVVRNRGDRPLVITQAETDNPHFTVETDLPVTVPPEFEHGSIGVRISIRYNGSTEQLGREQLGRVTLHFAATDIGPVTPVSIYLSGRHNG